MIKFIQRYSDLTAGFAVLLIVVVVYLPAMHGGFVWDDDVYLLKNKLLTDADGFRRMWFSLDSPSQYFPLVYTTFRIEHALWGLNPVGYHIINILLHAINVLLVWQVLRRLSIRGAWLAAAIFAVHPVHVESVAWITERKNVLSTLFYMLTMLAWLKFVGKSRGHPWRYYALAIVLYALALFSKTTACTLPAALLIVLWIKGERIRWKRLAQVIPFVIMGVVMGLVSVWWERYHQGTTGPEFALAPLERVLIASRALWFYLGKLLWPANLTFSYPRWNIDASDPLQYGWVVGCVCVVVALWWWRRALGRGPLLAGVFFAATLAPMLGFISLYTFRYSFVADHYQYVASLGPTVLFAAALMRKWQVRGRTYQVPLAVPLIILCVLSVLTWRQAHIYKDQETLWRDTLAKNPSSWMAYDGLGVVLYDQGKLNEAIRHYTKALQIKPDHPEGHVSLAAALADQGRLDEAADHYVKGLELRPSNPRAHYGLANVLVQQGRLSEAIDHYSQALDIDPSYAAAHCNLGVVFVKQGDLEQAVKHFSEALKIDPSLEEARGNLQAVLQQRDAQAPTGDVQRDEALAHYNLALQLDTQGKTDEAIREYREAIRIRPDFAEAHCNLGLALRSQDKTDEAIREYQEAVRIKPDLAEAHHNLAVAYYLKGDAAEAWKEVRLCRRYGVTPNPDFLAVLSRMMPEPGE